MHCIPFFASLALPTLLYISIQKKWLTFIHENQHFFVNSEMRHFKMETNLNASIIKMIAIITEFYNTNSIVCSLNKNAKLTLFIIKWTENCETLRLFLPIHNNGITWILFKYWEIIQFHSILDYENFLMNLIIIIRYWSRDQIPLLWR